MIDVVLDLETNDPGLKEYGTDAHTRRRGGYVFLAGIFVPSQGRFNISEWKAETRAEIGRMLDEGGYNWIGANIKYDLNWLLSEGVLKPEHTLTNRFSDILIDAPLIDETQPVQFYSLDGQCQHYNFPMKPKEGLLEAALANGVMDRDGKKPTQKTVMGLLHLLPRTLVEEYLRHDLTETWNVWLKQRPLIIENKLERVQELESKLIPILAMMENKGVRVDVEAAQQLYDQAFEYIESIRKVLQRENGGNPVPLNACNALTEFVLSRGHVLKETKSSGNCRAHKVKNCDECAKVDRMGNKTHPKPRYCMDAATFDNLALIDPLMADILSARKAEKIAKDFAKGAIIDTHVNGRIHGNINQIIGAKEDGEAQGVRYGRLSMSKPNLQQVPKKDSVDIEGMGGLGSAMRRLFIAEEGCQLMSADFSSQEPRWIIHWCETWRCPGAEFVGDMYRKDPTISSHDIVAGGITGELPYKQKRALAKIINLGKGYEMGLAKLVRNLVAGGVDGDQAQRIMDDFDSNFPHVKAGSDAAKRAAEKNGYVRTSYGRKIHFNQWEPCAYNAGPAMDFDTAYQKYVIEKRTPIRRAYTYRAFNRVVQGSSADQTKAAMVALWYDHGILPTLQVHDELLDATITDLSRVAIYKQVMENVIPLTIPSLTEVKLGPNWKDGVIYNVAA